MKTSLFVVLLSLLCIVLSTTSLIEGQTHVVEQPQIKPITIYDTCACVDCAEDGMAGRIFEKKIECLDNQSPVIGSINMAIEGGTNKGFSYFTVDRRNRALALAGQDFEYDDFKSKENIQNCSMESSLSRFDESARYIIVRTKEQVKLWYNIKTRCGPKLANDHELTISDPNPKYYYGSKVKIELTFLNTNYGTVDTFLNGMITVQNAKAPQQWILRNGHGKIDLVLLEEFSNENAILFEFIPNSLYNEQKISNIPLRIPLIKKASKGDLLIHKKQTIYIGKEFNLYFNLYDSDNLPTPSIDIPLLSISSTNSNDNLYCQLTNYVNGYGFVTCDNIETSGKHTLVLKYNGVVLREIDITVEDNPYQYIYEAIVLLLLILIILSTLVLCVGLVSFVFFYKNLKKSTIKNSTNFSRVTREEEAEELDNL